MPRRRDTIDNDVLNVARALPAGDSVTTPHNNTALWLFSVNEQACRSGTPTIEPPRRPPRQARPPRAYRRYVNVDETRQIY